ncbi:MAG: glycosyltransferase family 4 protein [Nanoarchaeota archaeon]
MKPRLLITTDSFLPRWDGIARVLYETIPHISKSFRITVVCPDYGIAPNLPVTYLRFPVSQWRFGDFRPAKLDRAKLEAVIKQADVVFNHTIGPIGFNAIRLARKHNKPVIAYIHSIDWELFSKSIKWGQAIVYVMTRMIERVIYNKCQLLMVPSSDVAHILKVNRIKTSTCIIRLGVNTTIFVPAKNKALAKEKIQLPTNSVIIGFHGRISREKNLRTLRRGFDRLKKRFYNLRLLIVGSGVRQEEELFDIPRATCVGQVDAIVPYLQAMDIFVLPSLTETSSLSTMEAMSCGLPVVVTRVGNTKYYIKPGINGFFFKRKSSKSLAKVLRALILDESLRYRLGRAARTTAMNHFDWEVTAKKMIELLKKFGK